MESQSKSFSKEQTNSAVLLTLLLLSACSSTPVRESAEDQQLKPRQVQKIYKGALFDAYFHDQAVVRAVEQAKDDPSEAVFRAYCQDGKQIRDLSYQLKIIPPSAPKAIPVDRAAKIAASAASQLVWIAKNFFRTMERPEMDPKDQDLAFDRDYVTVGGGGMNGLLKNAALIPASDEIRYDRVAEDGPKLEYVFISLGGSKILLSERRILPEERLRYGSYAVDSEQTLRGRVMQVDLARALPGEWSYFSRLVLLPPKKEFQKWLSYREKAQESASDEAYSGLDHPEALYGESGAIVIEEAVKWAYKLWDLYVLSFSSSKAATQADGSTNVEVSLDLSGVCAYGRPRSMLLSR